MDNKPIVFGRVFQKTLFGEKVYFVRLRKYFKADHFEDYDDIILIDHFGTKEQAANAIRRSGYRYTRTWGDANEIARLLSPRYHTTPAAYRH